MESFQRCAGCGNLTPGPSYTEGMVEGEAEIIENPGSPCSQTIICRNNDPSNDSFVSITVEKQGSMEAAEAGMAEGEDSVSATLECGEDGFFYLPKQPTTPLSGLFFCESKFSEN